MPGPTVLQKVLGHAAVWRGNECAQVALPSIPTGFAELDVLLPGGGWPRGALTELYAERAGIGEFRLLMAAAARTTREERWLALIAPPHIPYAPALAAHGVLLNRLLVVQPQAAREKWWACEQALRAGTCGMVMLWPGHATERELRRLALAAEAGGSAAFLFYAGRAPQSSPAALRLSLSGRGSRTVVRILKRRGGGMPAPVTLDLFKNVAGAGIAAAPGATGMTGMTRLDAFKVSPVLTLLAEPAAPSASSARSHVSA